MSKILISHESPITLLPQSLFYNDYDYALVHLFEKYPEYYNFFRESLAAGRHVLLDNSIFELGEAFDMKKFCDWVIELEPTEYIIPDVLDDADGTIANLELWFDKYYDKIDSRKSQPIAVIQGATYVDLLKCYLTICSKGVKRVAVSFNYRYYENEHPELPKEEAWMIGRVELMRALCNFKIDTEFHLLGCSLPQEFLYYRNDKSAFSKIKSLDTSCPIVHGLKGVLIDRYEGLKTKESTKLVDLIEADPTFEQRELIHKNIETFRKLVNR